MQVTYPPNESELHGSVSQSENMHEEKREELKRVP